MIATSDNQSVTCYRKLISRLKRGEIKPGDYLREQMVAEEFGVSRTPVREALRQLETEGLAVAEPRLGMRIRSLDYTEVMELYEVREVHERAVARIAATKATDIELQELESIQALLEAARSDTAKMVELNQQFHYALLQIAKNRFLTKAVESMQRTVYILGPSTLLDDARASSAIKEHRALIQALHNHDPDTAEATMTEHWRNAQRSRIRQYQQEPWSA